MVSKLILLLYVLSTSAALVLLKLASEDGAPVNLVDGKFTFNINILTVIGVGLFGVSFILYTSLISNNDLGYIVPLTTALVYVLIFTASYFIFQESFTLLKVLAIALIVTGIALLSFNSA